MSLLTIAIIAFAVAVGAIFMLILASILAAGIFFLMPRLAHSWAALSLWVLAKHAAATLVAEPLDITDDKPETFVVMLCHKPLAEPEYLLGVVDRKPVFGPKQHGKKFSSDDKLALRAFFHFFETRGVNPNEIFIVYADRRAA